MHNDKTMSLVSYKACMVAILLTVWKLAELPLCASSWFLQKGRPVGLAYYSRIELISRVLLHKRLCFVFLNHLFYVSAVNVRKVIAPVEQQKMPQLLSEVPYFPFRNNTFLCR